MTDDIQLLRSLRAVRRFSDEPIPDDALDDVLQVARWTGSAKNVQPWHLVVVRDRDTLRQLSECGDFAQHLAGAKLAIALVMNDRRRLRRRPAGAKHHAGGLGARARFVHRQHLAGS